MSLAWTESVNPAKLNRGGSCAGPTFSVSFSGLTYSRVCGQVTGYAVYSPNRIEALIMVMLMEPQQHIQAFAAGQTLPAPTFDCIKVRIYS